MLSHPTFFPKQQNFLSSSGELCICRGACLQWIPTSEAVTSVIPLAISHQCPRDRAGLPLVARAEVWGQQVLSYAQVLARRGVKARVSRRSHHSASPVPGSDGSLFLSVLINVLPRGSLLSESC